MIERLLDEIRGTGANVYRITEIEGGDARTYTIHHANACNNSYSVAKAFTMTAVGILQDRGALDVHDRIADIFCGELPPAMEERWERVTVEHALTHRLGIDRGFLDIDCEDIFTYGTDDFLRIVLERPLPHEPGAAYVYSDAAFSLLSRVVSKITGERLDDFLMRELFLPLGFQEAAWSKCPRGYPMGATGLYIRTCDMAKLGVLYLQKGEYAGRRILSEAWVTQALACGYELTRVGNGYGKGGMLGQMLYVNPAAGRVVAWHGHDHDNRVGKVLELIWQNE